MDIRHIAKKFINIDVTSIRSVSGGDINQAFAIESVEGKFFVKVNHLKALPQLFQGEQNGLEALQRLSNFRIPKVLAVGNDDEHQYLFLEHIHAGSPAHDFWQVLGRKLALMHQQSSSRFGWETDNFLGSLRQYNTWADDWGIFFSAYRILPLVRSICDNGVFSRNDMDAAERLCSRADDIFPPEVPSFIHGDLWSGNFMIDEYGSPALIDPAVCYAHRELDIALTKLFGGFSEEFYTAYNEIYPLEKDWKSRLPITQLYHLLLHAKLFGGHYISRCKEILRRF